MEMTSPDHRDLPRFGKAWNALPFKFKLMLMHLWRAEQEAAGAYPSVDEPESCPVARRRTS
jgi:hypothetical protein